MSDILLTTKLRMPQLRSPRVKRLQLMARLQKDLDGTEKYADSLEKKLSNKEFVDNAPQDIVKTEQIKLDETKEKIAGIMKQIEALS